MRSTAPVTLLRAVKAATAVRTARFALVLGALAAILGFPAAARAAAAPTGPALPAHAAARLAVPAHAVTAAVPASVSATGGICQVPGIGEIGGLLGFCAAGSSGVLGALNDICQPSVPTPEPATGGIDTLVRPPGPAVGPPAPAAASATVGSSPPTAGKATLYQSYGMAGVTWNAYGLKCSDMASLIGNNVAGVVFDAAKALDRVTITVYQAAAGPGILSWLTGAVDKLITSLGNAIYFPYLAPVVILGAIWLAWQGLIRKRATRTIEGTIWMVIACATAVWLIGRPADFTGFGKTVSDGITQTLNAAFGKLPAPQQSNCVPVGPSDPQVPATANYNFSSGTSVVDTNANELWTVLVCKPWLDGEFGTTGYSAPGKGHPTVINTYGRQLLWAQAIAADEKPTPDVIQAKEDTFVGIANSMQKTAPAVYPLFQGKQWTSRLEIAFAALFAALLAGLLVLLIAITLIVLKLGFLLLLVAGPFFLIVGTHPGFGRVIALRWGELLIGVLLKQAAIALVLSVLLYAYSLIMGTSDVVLPWALKILMISLVTVAVFIYRKPFAHLFSAVGYGVIGSRERAQGELARAGSGATRNTLDTAAAAIPGFGAYRVARWARRNPAQAAGVAAQVAAAGSGAMAGVAAAGASPGAAGDVAGADLAEPGPEEGGAAPVGGSAGGVARGRARAGAAPGGSRTPPPLDLPPRRAGGSPPPSGWARGGAGGTGRSRDGSAAPAGHGASYVGNGYPTGNGQAGNGVSRTPTPPSARPRAGWVGPGPRQAPDGSGPPAGSRPAAPAPMTRSHNGHSPGQAAGHGNGAGGAQRPAEAGHAGPFWLRPLRRRK
jgi:hypothetical protein